MIVASSSSSSSSSSATVAVDKATSDLLISPDWTMNIDICDSVNSHHWQAKDVVKAVKRRLQHKSSKVQFLALTLLETMVKNCGDYVHVQIAERNILGEMVKIVRKKADMQVREKILILLDCWQEAFGGPGGKHPQYYWACEELRRSGVEFPKHSLEAPAIFTQPVTQTTLRQAQAGYGMPSNSSRRLDETMATEMENLSLSSLDSMRNVMELLSDMLQAVNPSDRMAIKDEVIVDLVNRCRANQKKLMQMLTTTGDEELLARGLDLNDGLQSLLAKYDAIVSGLPVPTQAANVSPQPTEKSVSCSKQTEVKDSRASDSSPKPNTNPSAPVGTMTRVQIYEDEEEEDEFAQLARRHIKPRTIAPQNTSSGSDDGLALVSTSSTINPSSSTATSVPSNALALPDPPAQVKTTKEQDMIDLLSITLSTTAASPDTTPHAPASNPQAAPSNGNMPQVPVSASVQGNPYPSQPYPGNLGMASQNSYVVPWAQPQPQLQQQFRPQLQPQTQPQFQSQFQPQTQPQFQSQFQPQYSSGYPPPPWAATPGYSNNQNHLSANNTFSTPRANATTSYMPAQGARPLQHFNSFPARGINGSDNNGGFPVIPGPRSPAPAAGQKPFVPSYRLFEDLNVFGNADGKFKMTNSNTSSSLSGTAGQGMVGGRK